ncbi:MAG TPA: dienelactone hydrolase family protein, partial [Candidatus Nitrosotenuis sp.]|nr:dienelactone hydrolase family protein [Candidatus Nitrosotenuis sp.]
VNSPILGIYGREDKNIPVSDVMKFESELDDLGINNEFHIYDEAGHAFANPSAKSYFKNQAQDAWSRTIVFLAKNLQS